MGIAVHKKLCRRRFYCDLFATRLCGLPWLLYTTTCSFRVLSKTRFIEFQTGNLLLNFTVYEGNSNATFRMKYSYCCAMPLLLTIKQRPFYNIVEFSSLQMLF